MRFVAVTVVLDSWAVLCLLGNEQPGAERVERALADRPVMSWINLGEVMYVLRRRRGPDEANAPVRDLVRAVDVELPTKRVVRQAADVKARHAMAHPDAFTAATAMVHRGQLWTGDPELLIPDSPWHPVDRPPWATRWRWPTRGDRRRCPRRSRRPGPLRWRRVRRPRCAAVVMVTVPLKAVPDLPDLPDLPTGLLDGAAAPRERPADFRS